ncbi:MAG: circadian clock protein KaiC [Methylicorpusculum sp.]|uniref:circadian clock protein KaiC n=1 Tax=Methylicorpusculum sp. TaxID=2713644 RepID=UPI0027186CFD|nr:circadian clock protein KaiC [Methylicorpusculum sp.]MDO8938298.1 circadian clock protein KaiC [Methylicorpusculum sp.]MDP2200623.1 circadian clock protein KaiC [Methylicorpusculum sp.]
MATNQPATHRSSALPKSPTGIQGLDEITGGGLPSGRPTLVCGSAGCGKTMLAMEFLVRGATQFDEPGVFMMFEENAAELTANVRSLGFDLDRLAADKKIVLDYVHIERSEIEETGEYDLEGLFIRLGYAIDSIGAKRVVLDTVEALFAGLPNHAILRAELRRLFRWLKDRGMTAIITGERGEGNLMTRYGLEEYVADCVITLDQRVAEQISTRRLRIVKYRGTAHGTNEYPFLINERGLSVLPITSLQLDHEAFEQRHSTGIAQLDHMLGGKGVFRGSSVLVSGSPGTGKSSIGAAFVDAACRRGERSLLFAYEESPSQIFRNMRSIGIDLEPWVKDGLLQINSSRPTLHGLEQHLVLMHDTVSAFLPAVVAVDPISNLTLDRNEIEVKPMLMRLIDFLKQQQITTLFTSLTAGGAAQEDSQVGVSSLMDTWLLLRNVEFNGERNRTLNVLKSRGMAHSNQIREFVLSEAGIDLVDVYRGSDCVLTGTARVAQETRELAATELRRQDHERKLRQLAAKQKTIEAQIAALQAEAESEAAELNFTIAQETLQEKTLQQNTDVMAQLRDGDKTGKRRIKETQ